MHNVVWMALGLVLILEGLMPVVAPNQWRSTLLKLTQLSDGQVRWMGIFAMILGIVILQLNR